MVPVSCRAAAALVLASILSVAIASAEPYPQPPFMRHRPAARDLLGSLRYPVRSVDSEAGATAL